MKREARGDFSTNSVKVFFALFAKSCSVQSLSHKADFPYCFGRIKLSNTLTTMFGAVHAHSCRPQTGVSW